MTVKKLLNPPDTYSVFFGVNSIFFRCNLVIRCYSILNDSRHSIQCQTSMKLTTDWRRPYKLLHKIIVGTYWPYR